jgi:hypothetical protein
LDNRDIILSLLVNSPYVNPAYQWQKSSNGRTTWANIGGASISASSLTSQTYVAASNSVPFTVNPLPVISIFNNNPVCDSSTFEFNSNHFRRYHTIHLIPRKNRMVLPQQQPINSNTYQHKHY